MDPASIIALIQAVASVSGQVLTLAAQAKATASETDIAKIEAAEALLAPKDDTLHAQVQAL